MIAMTKRLHRRVYIYGTILLIVALLGVSSYVFIIRPDDEADQYNQKLRDAAVTLHATFTALAQTTQLNIFNTPDGTLTSRLQNLDSITHAITTTRTQLNHFKAQANDLRAIVHLSVFTSYHDAEIGQQNARDIVSQTTDVLNQYQSLANFLRKYYMFDNTFTTITGTINAVNNLDTLIPDSAEVYTDGQSLASLATSVRTLAAPQAYASLLSTAATVYQQASQGLQTLAYGLSINYDPDKDSGIALVEQAVNQHDNTLANMPFNDTQDSYVLAQVSELPDKTDSILSAYTSGD